MGILTERHPRNPPGCLIAALLAIGVLALGGALWGLRGLPSLTQPRAESAQAQAAEALPTHTSTPEPTSTPTINPDIPARERYLRDAAEAEYEAARLKVTIVAAQATDDEIRRRDQYGRDAAATERARETAVIATSEAISRTALIEVEQASIELAAVEARNNLEIGGKVVLWFLVFVVGVTVCAVSAYIVVTAWRQAGQPPQAEMAVYELPEPQEIETKIGDNLAYPLKTSSVTRDELRLIAQAKRGRQITVRAVEAQKISSERWSVISSELINAGYFVGTGNVRIRVFTTDEGESLLKDYGAGG